MVHWIVQSVNRNLLQSKVLYFHPFLWPYMVDRLATSWMFGGFTVGVFMACFWKHQAGQIPHLGRVANFGNIGIAAAPLSAKIGRPRRICVAFRRSRKSFTIVNWATWLPYCSSGIFMRRGMKTTRRRVCLYSRRTYFGLSTTCCFAFLMCTGRAMSVLKYVGECHLIAFEFSSGGITYLSPCYQLIVFLFKFQCWRGWVSMRCRGPHASEALRLHILLEIHFVKVVV